jgi:hypothetical protein
MKRPWVLATLLSLSHHATTYTRTDTTQLRGWHHTMEAG